MAENNTQTENSKEEWKDGARELQQEFYEKLGDRRWDQIKSDQRWALESKVAFAMFGAPKEEEKSKDVQRKQGGCEFKDENLNIYYENGLHKGYTKKQIEAVKRICNKIYGTVNSKDILIAFLFVVGNTGSGSFIIPFFRIKKYPDGDVYFIDDVCRVYKSWENYKNDNKLPAAEVLYPSNGIYDSNQFDEVCLEYAETPASTIAAKTVAVVDTGVGVTSVILAGVGIASMFFPPAAPIATAAAWASAGCGVYGASRGSYVLYDRSKHEESLSLANSEARNCWLSVVGSAFGVGSGLAMKGMVAAVSQGQVIGTAGRVVVNFLNFGSLTVNGVGIANQIATLVDKGKNDELTAMDFLQFGTSVLFFTNSAMNARTASTIIDQVQRDTLSNFTSDLSKRRTKAFNKIVKNSGGAGTTEDRARIIKGITNVGSKDEFFRMTIRAQKQSSDAALNNKGNLELGGKAYVDTDIKLQTHVKVDSSTTVTSNSASSSSNTLQRFNERLPDLINVIAQICIENKKDIISLANDVKVKMKDLYTFFAKLFQRYFNSNGKNRFPTSRILDFINSSELLAQSQGCKTKEDFIDFARFLCIYERCKLNELEGNYQEEKKRAMELLGDLFDESKFAFKFGIEDFNNRDTYFLNKINDEIIKSEDDLRKRFELREKEISAINRDGGLMFRTNYHALNEYYHCFMVEGTELSPSEFFDMIRRTVMDDKSRIIVDIESKFCTYCNEIAEVKVVLCEKGSFLDSVKFIF